MSIPLASITAGPRLSPKASACHIPALQSLASGTEHGITRAAYSFLAKLAQSDFYSPLRLSNTRPFPPSSKSFLKLSRNNPSPRSFHPIPVLLHGRLENKNPRFPRSPAPILWASASFPAGFPSWNFVPLRGESLIISFFSQWFSSRSPRSSRLNIFSFPFACLPPSRLHPPRAPDQPCRGRLYACPFHPAGSSRQSPGDML